MFDNLLLTKMKVIEVEGGNIFHIIKKTEKDFMGFGEAYFSLVNFNMIKAWKKHTSMTSNLVVPVGNVKFVFFCEKEKCFREEIIGENNYSRITIPPNIWFGFKGLEKKINLILNIANITHNDNEVIKKDLSEIFYKW